MSVTTAGGPASSYPSLHPAGISSGSNLLSFMSSAPIFSTGSLPSTSGASELTAHQSLSPAGASPSLATLLATPLANLGPSKTPPLVLSSALPPIPGKVVESIRSGAFVDFRDLLSDNVALRQRVIDTGLLGSQSLRLREIGDVETWLCCFLAFVAAKVDCRETRDLMAYGQIILMLARKHGGLGWRAYDAHFRQLQGAGHNLPWTELNPSMLAANVLQAAGLFCSICQSHDHRKEDCALAPPTTPADRRPRPYRPSDEVCRRFNRTAGCSSSNCRFTHKCWSCGLADHGASACKGKPESSRTRPQVSRKD
ncbi:PREDICTED: uncharacterized protein LOC109587203 [Amphimedon queenslandica]|uniref:C3H1-type domain-containing protein n=1 Tax=Amphimedon queenslandica TaxID=400682 RepID=A0AAN0JPP4_AMPQE|nr:PREDICTED: uncharacterized protein LOC109587203 [Amphimedon queenslandica]|eukprot:XP_019858996.1 PREDICTED: uncharacterized protein LOC109587203 [Amphimedon queenslandica]